VRFHIQQESDIPASTQLNNQICFAIAARHFPPGHRLPSTRQLAMQTGLHRNTISKVYRQLEIDGVVEAIAGSGIYVRDNLTKREFKKSVYSKNKIIRSKKLFEIPKYNDEIGKLTKSFETMISEIEKRVNDIESFAADVAHELKNPLTSLRSASETFIQSKNKKDQKQMIEIMFKDIDRIDRLITDISFSSRLDADLVRTKFENIDLFKLLENYISIRATKLKYKIIHDQNETDIQFIGNSNKLVQVFDNLIDNSLSIIGKNCKINIRVFSKGKKIFILFEDNGPGFPKNAINKIFDRFYTDRINQKEFGKHSGLGLSISKQIISAHNGDIFAENIINDDKKIIGARVNIILNK